MAGVDSLPAPHPTTNWCEQRAEQAGRQAGQAGCWRPALPCWAEPLACRGRFPLRALGHRRRCRAAERCSSSSSSPRTAHPGSSFELRRLRALLREQQQPEPPRWMFHRPQRPPVTTGPHRRRRPCSRARGLQCSARNRCVGACARPRTCEHPDAAAAALLTPLCLHLGAQLPGMHRVRSTAQSVLRGKQASVHMRETLPSPLLTALRRRCSTCVTSWTSPRGAPSPTPPSSRWVGAPHSPTNHSFSVMRASSDEQQGARLPLVPVQPGQPARPVPLFKVAAVQDCGMPACPSPPTQLERLATHAAGQAGHADGQARPGLQRGQHLCE